MLLSLAVPQSAQAKKQVVSADISYGIGQESQDLQLRYGWRWQLVTVMVQGDLTGGVSTAHGEATPMVLAGVTVGAGPLIQPRVFGRVGVLLADGSTPLLQELGAALVFTALPVVEVGLNASYNGILGDAGVDQTWFSAGVEASAAF